MKSEERHKLQQNELADWLAKVLTSVKPYQNAILGAAIVVIIAALIALWWSRESGAQSEKVWTQFFAAFINGNAPEMYKVSQSNLHSPVGSAATLVTADLQLAQGCNQLFINKAAANQALNNAVELYKQVLIQSKSDVLQVQAMFGLAKARESQGILEEAGPLYMEVTKKWPDSAYAWMAARRLEDLKRNSTKKMYDKFALYDPQPAFSQQPGDKPNLDKLPEESPISTPDAAAEEKPAEQKEEKTDKNAEETKPAESRDTNADPATSTP